MTTKDKQIAAQEAELVALRAELEAMNRQKPVAYTSQQQLDAINNPNSMGDAGEIYAGPGYVDASDCDEEYDIALFARPVPAAAVPSATYQRGYAAAEKQCRKQIKIHRDEIGVLEQALKAARAAAVPAVDAMTYPDEMTDAVREVLSMMCFEFIDLARLYRDSGFAINKRAEDEQSFFLHRLTKLALAHGDQWRKAFAAELKPLVVARKAAAASQVAGGDA